MIYTATFHFLAVQHEGEMKGAKDYTKHDMHILVLNIKLAGELSYDSYCCASIKIIIPSSS